MTAPTFTPLDFPPWLRWCQRGGALIDNDALRAIYPDHRHYRLQLDGSFVLAGSVRHCGWCGAACKGRRTSWCSETCSENFYRVWSWGAVAQYVFARDGRRCQRCEADSLPVRLGRRSALECDHIVPVRDGGTDDPANLRTLCHDCHIAVGYEQRAARKKATA